MVPILLLTLSAIGMIEAVYLIRKRVASEEPTCLIGKGCGTVLMSKYNKLFIIPNDILGLFVYVAIFFVIGFLVIGIGPRLFWGSILSILVGAASIASLVFTYLQWRVIRAWCFWCLVSASIIWLMEMILVLSPYPS